MSATHVTIHAERVHRYSPDYYAGRWSVAIVIHDAIVRVDEEALETALARLRDEQRRTVEARP